MTTEGISALPVETRLTIIATYRELAAENNRLGFVAERDYCLERAALFEAETATTVDWEHAA